MGRPEKHPRVQPIATAARTQTATGIRLRLRVQPRSSRDEIVGFQGDALKLRVSAPPVGGEANRAAIQLLARWLEVPAGAVSVVRGHSGRDKVVHITADPTRIAARLAGLLARVDKCPAGD